MLAVVGGGILQQNVANMPHVHVPQLAGRGGGGENVAVQYHSVSFMFMHLNVCLSVLNFLLLFALFVSSYHG